MLDLYNNLKSFWWRSIRFVHPKLFDIVYRYRIFLKYVISGGTAAAVNMISLTVFVEVFDIHYLKASAFAFMLGFLSSFVLQKFFTFGDTRIKLVHVQLVMYLFIALINLGLNTVLVYSFVEYAGFWYLFSQFLSSNLIAFESYFLYKRFVFKKNNG